MLQQLNRVTNHILRNRKSHEDLSIEQVTKEIQEKIMSAKPRSAEFESKLNQGDSLASLPDEEEGRDDEAPSNAAANTSILFPMEGPEAQSREWLNLFMPEKCSRIVQWGIGSGMMALAACRQQVRYVGFAFSDLHRSVCHQILVLRVVKELILQVRDGFTTTRFLSKTRSLTGSETDPAPSETLELNGLFEAQGSEQKDHDGEEDQHPPAKKHKSKKTKKKAAAATSSSSSSSS